MGLASYLDEIDQTVDAGLRFAGILAALTVPDICGALEAPEDRVGERYARWYDSNAGGLCKFLNGAQCYRLRCGMVHQGRARDKALGYDRVAFTWNGNHCNVIKIGDFRYLNLGVTEFVKGLTGAARAWLVAKSSDPIVVANLDLMLQTRAALPHPIVNIGHMIY